MARERQRRQRFNWENSDLEHFGARAELRAIREPCTVCDPDHARRVALGNVIDANQRRQLDRCADLLHALAYRGVRWVLVMVDESPG
jgi:hypothetical protein